MPLNKKKKGADSKGGSRLLFPQDNTANPAFRNVD